MTEKIVTVFYLYALTYTAGWMIFTGNYSGELGHFKLGVSTVEVTIIYCLTVLGLFSTYVIYQATKNKKLIFGKERWKVIPNRLNLFFFVFVIANIVFFLKTNVGLAGGGGDSKYSSLFALMKIDVVFLLFYFFCRKAKDFRYLFWINVFLFSSLSLLKAWTGFLLFIVIYEIHFYLSHRKINAQKKWLLITILPLSMFIVGGAVYQEAYSYKFEARGMSVPEPTLPEAIDKLVNRVTFFPISVGVYEKQDVVQLLYDEDNVKFKELKGSLRQLVPRFVMEEKEFRSLNNNSKQAFMEDLSASTSNNFGFFMYAVTLFSVSVLEGALWLILTLASIIIVKSVLDSIEQYPGQLNLLYFLLLIKVFSTASLEATFGNSYAYLLFIIPAFLLLGIIKIRRRISNGSFI